MSGCVCLWLSNRVQWVSVCTALTKENLVCPAAMTCAIVTLIASMFVCVCLWLAVPSEEQATSEQPKNCHRLTELVLPLHTLCACLSMCLCVSMCEERGRRWGCQTWTHERNACVCVCVCKKGEWSIERERTYYNRYITFLVCVWQNEETHVCALHLCRCDKWCVDSTNRSQCVWARGFQQQFSSCLEYVCVYLCAGTRVSVWDAS